MCNTEVVELLAPLELGEDLINYALGFSAEVWHLRRESDLGYKLFSGESQSPHSQTMHATIEQAGF